MMANTPPFKPAIREQAAGKGFAPLPNVSGSLRIRLAGADDKIRTGPATSIQREAEAKS
jgi:hypothetical protein